MTSQSDLESKIQNPKSKIADLPIGIFDSGVGGLTVYRALHNQLPNEHFIYLGDTARVPYGTKSLATVERYAIENSLFLAAKGIKLLVVACNTASAVALPKIREVVDVDVVGVIGPGGRKAVAITKEKRNAKIGVIATEATVQSNAYADAISRATKNATVIQAACPLFVSLAEEGWAESDEARSIARKYLAPIVTEKVDALVLGCTHYPILKNVIREIVGEEVALIDSGEATAEEIAKLLTENNLANPHPISPKERKLCDDLDHFFVTDAAERFARIAVRFLGSLPTKLEAVEVFGVDKLESKTGWTG